MKAHLNSYVVIVTFEVKMAYRGVFREAILENASASRGSEPGCTVFDVWENQDGSEIFLYEVYNSEAAFKEHLSTEHFRRFETVVAPWIIDRHVSRPTTA
ncbi:putative quinol monooxygenase [Sinorhizobium medicae]|uniref:putative quinol monooxygenase n=1 Tax=Sinorhizobium medicae TaxID=110321 RepID=UPI001297B1AF|nr:putative quinol monooxygenase [Sinorhizobium medicae]MDX0967289.1 antibiotic biosynthesis monooxygenase [Sinorhizobium medicae]MQV47019.1 antibiotic biosynthesis monooxygenase [Sinorhizobium medicae]MQV53071.1 antibiotic biosynthesis monooxygenase [Sinorhizobium medicae]MQV75139.1 antibiotic biosynthesis monooxygenase [Sinorhizobium medicae]